MGGNGWVSGYLEAILDAGSSRRSGGERPSDDQEQFGKWKNNTSSTSTSTSTKKAGVDEILFKLETDDKEVGNRDQSLAFSPTKYFVEEVINSFDESDLHRTWIKVVATRNSHKRNNRLENMCWRIWHLSRKKKQIAWDDARKLARRKLEREKGRTNAAADLSELSGDDHHVVNTSLTSHKISRMNPDAKLWPKVDASRKIYIVLISLHGLVRGQNMELGRDSDTGGQVKYVVELARALAQIEGVYRVDLLTRQITSPEVDSSYGKQSEMLYYPEDGSGYCGAYITRIPCGPRNKYITKESLWPYIPEFVDGALSHIASMAKAIGGKGKPAWPYVIHGHYADAGEAAARLSGILNVPMVLTGHSLGRNKFEQLLQQGRLTREEINTTYKILRRIEAEELGLDVAEIVVTSTRQEVEEQWGLYDGFDIVLERKLRIRQCRGANIKGRHMPRMEVLPPGMDFSNVPSLDGIDIKPISGADGAAQKVHVPPIWSEISRFFTNRTKPMILALSRPDPKKNVTTLLKAFGECRPLRELANLTLILGNRDDIDDMSGGSAFVLTAVLKLIDKYDLYGHVAIPKHHKQREVPEIYRMAAKTKGVFINPALVEPFGLTLIEAAAYGLPIVATKNGGPVDILKVLNNGLLIDPHNQKDIADALLKLVADKNLWSECRKKGLDNIHRFSWPEHCRNYLSLVEECWNQQPTSPLGTIPNQEKPKSKSLKGIEDLSRRDRDLKVNRKQDHSSRQHDLMNVLNRKSSSKGISAPKYIPGKRQGLYVVATDCYNNNGICTKTLPLIIKNLKQVMGSGSSQIGLVLLTGLTITEVSEVLKGSDIRLEDFDALICSSGSVMYYPWKDLSVDEDYEAHIEYRWPGECLKSTVMELAKMENGDDNDVKESPTSSNSRCFSYTVRPGSQTRKVNDLKQELRMTGFRCNLVYTHAASRLNVIPLFASRANVLRYLSVRWGIDVSNMFVFVGERGDTDRENLLAGLHKTVILKGSVEYGSEMLLRGFEKEHILPQESTREAIIQGFKANDISTALKAFRKT